MTVPPTTAAAWAETVLDVLATPYPYASGHVSRGPDDTAAPPQVQHPAFHGSLDWHSAVHMLWSALHLRPRVDRALARRLDQALTERLTEDRLRVETAYLDRHPGFERPYGWAWLLMLADAATRTGPPGTGAALAPLAEVITDRFHGWLPRLAYPVRHGVHANTAFALGLAWDARPSLRELVTDRATAW